MKSFSEKYKPYLHNRKFLESSGLAILFLAASTTISYFAGVYATVRASDPVTDIILSNIRVYDVDGIFIYGPLFLIVIIGWLCLSEPRRFPFMIKSLALFIVIRSVFVTLTHIAPFLPHVYVDAPPILGLYTSGSDLFFSGHTGIPFLMALIFWQHKVWRTAFIAISVFFGIIVLMGHLHYSIDVMSAFFITYSIFHIAEKFFGKEQKIFFDGLPER
jgi:hypothetical protein